MVYAYLEVVFLFPLDELTGKKLEEKDSFLCYCYPIHNVLDLQMQ